MKKILNILVLLLIITSCEDHRLDGLEPDRVYLPKYGLIVEEAYTIGENAECNLWAYKSSFNGTSCSIDYSIDEALLEEYNSTNGTSYELLPESCYSVPSYSFDIAGKDEYAKFVVEFSPEKIVELCGGKYNVDQFALPIRITSDDVEITERNSAIVVYRIKEPIIKMQSSVLNVIKFDSGQIDTKMQSVKFGMDFDSKWKCAYSLETDEEVLNETLKQYNEANKTNYLLLNKESYTLSASEGIIGIGQSNVSVDIAIDPTKCLSGLYALPVCLKSVNEPLRIDSDNAVCFVPVLVMGDYIDKDGWTVKVSSANPNYGKPEYLIDGQISTYWHPAGRDFGQGRDDHPNAIVDMNKNVRVSCIEIDPRQDQFYPQIFSDLRCYISSDGTNFTEIGHVAIPWTKVEKCTVHVTPSVGKYVKFSVEYPKGQTSIAFAELSVRGELQ